MRRRVCFQREEIPGDQISKVYSLVERAIQNTDIDGKTTNEIFGEIYTKFRTEAVPYGAAGDPLRKFFAGRLKALNGTPAGDKLNEIINELYNEHVKNKDSLLDLELCTIIMNDCVQDAKAIGIESEKVINSLEQIDYDLCGGK